jgi:hypothetical protein
MSKTSKTSYNNIRHSMKEPSTSFGGIYIGNDLDENR